MPAVSERSSLLRNGETPRLGGYEDFGEMEYNIVSWDGDDDPANPMNWNERKKWSQVAIVAVLTFLVPLGATMFAPGVKQAMERLHSENAYFAPLAVSIYVLGWSLGSLVVAPLSEVRGCSIVYTTCNILFISFTVACALSPDVVTLIGFRFLEGAVSSAPLTIIVYDSHDSTDYLYGRNIRSNDIEMENQRGGGSELQHTTTVYGRPRVLQLADPVSRYCPPYEATLLCPINFLLSLAAAFMNGIVFILLTTLPMIFEKVYGFSATQSGLAFLGFGAGNIIGLFIFTTTSDRFIRTSTAQGIYRPEYRLIHVVFSMPLVAIGLCLYGWSAVLHTPYIVPILCSFLIGMANILFSVSLVGYLVDAFPAYSASVIAGNTVARSIGGTLLPLAGPKLLQALGLGWGHSVLGFVALAFTPALLLTYSFGENIRKRYPDDL